MKKRYLLVGFLAFGCSLMAMAWDSVDTQDVNPLQKRLDLFAGTQKLCMAKFLSNAELTANVLRAGNWSLSHVCECASALTVSKIADGDIASAANRENMDTFNITFSTNISTCVHIQP